MNKANKQRERIIFTFNNDILEITELEIDGGTSTQIIDGYKKKRNRSLVNGAIYWGNFTNKFYKYQKGSFTWMKTVSVPKVIRAWCLATGKSLNN